MYFLITTSVLLLGAVTAIACRSRIAKLKSAPLPLISSIAFVETQLNPMGTVLLRGDLWRAYSLHGNFVPKGARVTVVGLRDHLLLVEE